LSLAADQTGLPARDAGSAAASSGAAEPAAAGGGASRPPAIEARGISKRYGAVQALENVDFEVYPGEIVALVGDNGAGKSTLVKALAGAHAVDAGTIFVNGREAKLHTPADATALGIAVIYQDLALCDNLDVVENIFLGRELLRGFGGTLRVLVELEMERRAIETVRRLKVNIPNARSTVANLSGGQRQAVAIAKAVMWDPQVIILDEPTAALGVAQTLQIVELIKQLREQGHAVALISHNLSEIFGIADRIIVLRLGHRVATLDPKTATHDAVVAAITGMTLGETAPSG
jgi:D-xylose transport system ATP-binding protein